MGSTWRRAKRALGLNLCVYIPRTMDDPQSSDEAAARPSDASADSSAASDYRALMPTTPTPTSSGLRLAKSGSRSSSKKTCAICLGSMKPGHGHALFTAECSHTFHFHCIVANVKYGNRVCPVCRAKWKEIPFHGPQSSEHSHGRARVNPVNWSQEENLMNIVRRFPRANSTNRPHHLAPLFHTAEPGVFNDDEAIDTQSETVNNLHDGCLKSVEIKAYPEFSAIHQSVSEDNFTILVHLKAPHARMRPISGRSLQAHLSATQTSARAPVDLVTVLDISGSMAGTKLALLKRAMGFVIQNLGPSDRLSVVAFSSTARRLFPLRRMSDSGRQQALQAVNSLVSCGGTNITEGLRKGAKVIEERKEKNPVVSIILLSDGQDTYNVSNNGGSQRTQPDYQSLVPSSIQGGTGHPIHVHAFGFGVDHDSASMHTISEISGGTFSFIEAEGAIQDAFAQCIGGLLSVVVQEMTVGMECMHPNVHIGSIKSGSYANWVADNERTGSIDVGDLYADEERDFLVSVNVPSTHEETALLRVGCTYRDPVSKEAISVEGQEVRIQRPETVVAQAVSVEVDRQRNRVQAAEAMAEARAAAERGDLSEAVAVLEACRRVLAETPAARTGDRLCSALDAELKEMQERMANRQRYEASGRAYVLSGLSSHSWQRATARGDSTDITSLVHAYQTPTMVDMLQRSQTLCPMPPRPPIQPAKSFPAEPQPR